MTITLKVSRWLLCGLLLLAANAQANELVVYDDDVRNGFINLSWPGPQPHPDQNFYANFHQRQGPFAIFYKAHGWNGLSFGRPDNAWSTAQYSGLRLWIRGDAGGEQLTLNVSHNGTTIGSHPLDDFIQGGQVLAGQYREVVVDFTQPPWSHEGQIDRFDLQDASGLTGGNEQWVFIDDVSLVPAAGGNVPPGPSRNYNGQWHVNGEAGRGLNLVQYDNGVLFALWFIYDAQGRASWLQLDTAWTSSDVSTGRVVRWTGPAWGPTYNQNNRSYVDVGSFTLRFTSATSAVFTYSVDGVSREVTLSKL